MSYRYSKPHKPSPELLRRYKLESRLAVLKRDERRLLLMAKDGNEAMNNFVGKHLPEVEREKQEILQQLKRC